MAREVNKMLKDKLYNMKGKQPDHAILLKITFLQQC